MADTQYIGQHPERGIWQFPTPWLKAYQDAGFKVGRAREELPPVRKPVCLEPGTAPEKPSGAPSSPVLEQLVERVAKLEQHRTMMGDQLQHLLERVAKLEQLVAAHDRGELAEDPMTEAIASTKFDDLVEQDAADLAKAEAEQLLALEPGQADELEGAEAKAIAKAQEKAVQEHLERTKDRRRRPTEHARSRTGDGQLEHAARRLRVQRVRGEVPGQERRLCRVLPGPQHGLGSPGCEKGG